MLPNLSQLFLALTTRGRGGSVFKQPTNISCSLSNNNIFAGHSYERLLPHTTGGWCGVCVCVSRYCYLENVAAFCLKVWKPWPTRWATHSRNSTSRISMVSIIPYSFSSLLSLTSTSLYLVASAVDCEKYVRLNLAEGFQVISKKFREWISRTVMLFLLLMMRASKRHKNSGSDSNECNNTPSPRFDFVCANFLFLGTIFILWLSSFSVSCL